MSSTFDKREKGEETKFAMEAELTFKANARRAKLMGLWAADLMGIEGEAADAYAREVVSADLEEVGDDDLFAKIKGDLDGKGVDASEHQIRRQMEELLGVARQQVEAGE